MDAGVEKIEEGKKFIINVEFGKDYACSSIASIFRQIIVLNQILSPGALIGFFSESMSLSIPATAEYAARILHGVPKTGFGMNDGNVMFSGFP